MMRRFIRFIADFIVMFAACYIFLKAILGL